LDEDEEHMMFRLIDEGELKSDFDEIKGLGRVSIDEYTMESVKL
jgi:hypothetical protein